MDKKKQFLYYLYDDMDDEAADSPDNPRNFTGTLDPLISAAVSAGAGTALYEDFAERFGRGRIDQAVRCGILRREDRYVFLDTPVFLETDAPVLAARFASAAEEITGLLLDRRRSLYDLAGKIVNGYAPEINLYHIICGMCMDGALIDRLSQEGIISEGRRHVSGLNYLLVIYEQSPLLTAFSDSLLCSYNRCVHDGCALESFGDANGDRHDCYRYFRLREQGKLTEAFAGIHRAARDLNGPDLIRAARAMAAGQEAESRAVRALEAFGYAADGKLCVPVFTPEHTAVISGIEALLEKELLQPVAGVFEGIRDLRITPSLHHVPLKETANECWHILFGSINELLVKNGLVAAPETLAGEGRYLKCIEIS